MKFIHSYEAMFETMVATLFKFMCMHFDLFHNRDMAVIFVSNISIRLHPVILVCADLSAAILTGPLSVTRSTLKA